MATAQSNTTQINENLETYSLIWVDPFVNNSSDNRQAQEHLKAIINHLLTFEDDQQCLRYIKNLSKDDRIILIASGKCGRQIVPQIANLRQIISIYIYCMDKRANDQWAQQFTKVIFKKKSNRFFFKIHFIYIFIRRSKML
jgi:plasmid stabilization system protein ParE